MLNDIHEWYATTSRGNDPIYRRMSTGREREIWSRLNAKQIPISTSSMLILSTCFCDRYAVRAERQPLRLSQVRSHPYLEEISQPQLSYVVANILIVHQIPTLGEGLVVTKTLCRIRLYA